MSHLSFFKAEIEILIKIFAGKRVHYCKVWTLFFLGVVKISCTEALGSALVIEEVWSKSCVCLRCCYVMAHIVENSYFHVLPFIWYFFLYSALCFCCKLVNYWSSEKDEFGPNTLSLILGKQPMISLRGTVCHSVSLVRVKAITDLSCWSTSNNTVSHCQMWYEVKVKFPQCAG